MKKLSKKKVKERRKVGIAKAYISRAAAVKKLQVPLSDFRRLCILKGVYPVEPKNKSKLSGANTRRKTYFFANDIQMLMNEPVLFKFWEFKVFMKRLTRAQGRHDVEKFKRTIENKPFYSLDAIVKERYPRFVDALRDCDDALSMCFLFAMFPKGKGRPDDLIELSQQLTSEFMQYIIDSKSLRKVFISIKGYYYQAEIMGQTVTWIVPHQFVIDRVSDVDLNVMKTFTEFYVTILGFINYKLKKSLKSVANFEKAEQPDIFEGTEPDAMQEIIALERLFEGQKFFLNREVPQESLTFVIKTFGGAIINDESDSTITHQIVDRPSLSERRLDRVYIQPQWVYDSVNMRVLLPTNDYLIGATLPPHLSPFVNEKRGDYVPPDKIKLINLRKQYLAEIASEERVKRGEAGVESDLETDNEMERVSGAASENESEGENVSQVKKKFKNAADNDKDDVDSFDSKRSRDRAEKNRQKRERDSNKSTSRSKMTVKTGKLKVEDKEELKKNEDAEYRKMGIMMIPKKKKRLFDKITRTQKQKKQKVAKMKAKRRIVDSVKSKRTR